MIRRALTALVFLTFAALIGGSLVASAATVNDTACRALIKTSDGVSATENLIYSGCRFDKLDAAVKALGATSPTPSASPTPTVTPTPVVTPTTASPSPTVEPTISTPSPTATTTSAPAAAKCVGAANTPGGADPFGGCWPGPQNTGYPHGVAGDTRKPVTLTDYTGPTEIRSCGVVIDSKRVNGSLVILASNGTHSAATPCVTIKNSLVKGVIYAEQTEHGPTVITDTEVFPDGIPYLENVGRSNIFASRVDSHGGVGVFRCQAYCDVRDSYVHGMHLGGAYHYNAFGGNGMAAGSFVIDHNWASCGDWDQVDGDVQGDAGCSADIGFYGDFDPVQNITINRNMLTGMRIDPKVPNARTRQPGYCLNPGYYPGKPFPDTKNIAVTDNVFGRGAEGNCGVFGPTNSLNAKGKANGNTWSGNRYSDNGAVVARVEE